MVDAARALRGDPTVAEEHLWRYLRKRGLHGYRFRRQHTVGPFILDFYCHEARLAIEVDGEYHLAEGQRKRDRERDDDLAATGITTLRFTNEDVLGDTDRVLSDIRTHLDASL